jgi:uncharacterized protein YcsI (UPF0317 family)
MRPLTMPQLLEASDICSQYPLAHGAPLRFGDPERLGIADIAKPDYGDAVTIRDGELPVFWACGVTPQAALANAKPPFAITHKPGHMFLTDWTDESLIDRTV